MIRFRPWLYLALGVLETLFFGVFPQIVGWITYSFFNTLTGDAPASLGVGGLIVLLVVTAIVRVAAIFGDVAVYFTFQYNIAALLRKNLFEHILKRPGARAVPGSPGEAISRFRDDVDEIAGFMAESLILTGFALASVVAVVVMLSIDARITLVVFAPAGRRHGGGQPGSAEDREVPRGQPQGDGRCDRLHRRDVWRGAGGAGGHGRRAAGGAFPHAQRGAPPGRRSRIACSPSCLSSVFRNTATIGTGVILLLSAQAMRAGTFTVGDFALFVYYLGFVTDFTGLIGERWAWYKQVGVSVDRLLVLLHDAPPETLVKHSPVYMRGELPEVPYAPKTAQDRLEALDATGLTYLYPDSGRGVEDVDLHLERGSFTVITGRIGSGKTTLLRALLGLLPKDAGEIRWNGQSVDDPATFFVPPRSAYTAQVPLLFSESLRDNILMGLPEDRVDLQDAIWQAVMEQDVAELDHGLDTVIGAKGVKLSGGQRQRTAAARMFVRDPELLVFDDLSSALDVETERVLWERLVAGRTAGPDRPDLPGRVAPPPGAAPRRPDHRPQGRPGRGRRQAGGPAGDLRGDAAAVAGRDRANRQ